MLNLTRQGTLAKAATGGLEPKISTPQAAAVAAEVGPGTRLALIIPTLREAGNIKILLDRLRATLDPMNIHYSLIVVDDDSRDGIEAIVGEIAAIDSRVQFVVRRGQRGLAGAVIHGWQHTDAEILGVIDADLQHPPELLSKLWPEILNGSDVVVGSRYANGGSLGQWNPVRKGLSKLATWVTFPLQQSSTRVLDPMSGFFLIRRTCIENLELQTSGFKILLEILARGAVRKVAEVHFEFGRRQGGHSKASFRVAIDYGVLLYRLYRLRQNDQRMLAAAAAAVPAPVRSRI